MRPERARRLARYAFLLAVLLCGRAADAADALPEQPSSDGDVVEVIEPDAPSGVVAGPTPPPAPARPSCDEAGWAKQRGRLGLRSNDSPRVPYDRAASETMLFARLRCSSHSFEVVASGQLELAYFASSSGSRGTVGDDLAHATARQRYEATLGELYAGFSHGAWDVTAGQQRVAWGKSDLIPSPNDVLNARDLRRSPLMEAVVNQRPTPLFRLGLDLEALRLEGVLAPVFVPDRFDVYGGNWALLQPASPSGLLGLFGMASSMLDPSRLDDFNRLAQQTRLPRPGRISTGVKLTRSVGALDLDAYYHFGFERTPHVMIEPRFAALLGQVDFSVARPSDLGMFFDALATSHPPIRIKYERRHHVGAAAATVLGPFGLRLDAGYDTKRLVFRRDLRGEVSRAVQAVGSAEYQTGNLDTLIELEASALHLFDIRGRDWLFVSRTTLTLAGIVRFPIVRSWIVGLRAAITPSPRSVLLSPELTWKIDDDWSAGLTGLYLDGSRRSFGGYFSRNTEAELSVRYAF